MERRSRRDTQIDEILKRVKVLDIQNKLELLATITTVMINIKFLNANDISIDLSVLDDTSINVLYNLVVK